MKPLVLPAKKTANIQKNVTPSSEMPGEVPQKVEVKSHTRERKPKSRREDLYAKPLLIPLAGEQRFCVYCNAEMSMIGYHEVREELLTTKMSPQA